MPLDCTEDQNVQYIVSVLNKHSSSSVEEVMKESILKGLINVLDEILDFEHFEVVLDVLVAKFFHVVDNLGVQLLFALSEGTHFLKINLEGCYLLLWC